MDVRALWGVGPATGRRLTALGVRTVGDLAALPVASLERSLGRAVGGHLAALARGEDPRPVEPEQPMKSIGHEETFAVDVWDPAELRRHLLRLAEAAATQLRRSGRAARTVTVKVRFADFATVTRAHSLPVAVDATPAVTAVAEAQGVRLLGVSLSGLVDPGGGVQLALDLGGGGASSGAGAGADAGVDDPRHALAAAGDRATTLQGSWAAVTDAVDAIRARYGSAAVGAAASVGPGGVRVRQRGESQWGPDREAETGGPAPAAHPGADPVR
jgi:DNA polymerase-4